MILFNFVLSCICVWLSWWIYHRYIRMTYLNKERFELYALRDDLSLLAMRGIIDSSGKQYSTLIQMLNASISVMGEFDLTKFIKFCVRYDKDKKMRERTETLLAQIQHQDVSYRKIVHDYFSIMQRIINRHTIIFRLCIVPILKGKQFLIRIGLRLLLQVIEQRQHALYTIDSTFSTALKQAEAA